MQHKYIKGKKHKEAGMQQLAITDIITGVK